VLIEDQPLDRRVFLEHGGGFFCQRKARHDVGHEAQPGAEGFLAQRFAVGLINQAQDRSGMGVIDEFVR
jgi:hypothetical protein